MKAIEAKMAALSRIVKAKTPKVPDEPTAAPMPPEPSGDIPSDSMDSSHTTDNDRQEHQLKLLKKMMGK